MTGTEEETLEIIRGILIPLRWAEDGTVTTVGISGYGERDFLISSPESLDLWISLLRKEVEVVGVVTGPLRGLQTIKISEYRVLQKGEQK
jgi:phage FluMu protein gp41